MKKCELIRELFGGFIMMKIAMKRDGTVATKHLEVSKTRQLLNYHASSIRKESCNLKIKNSSEIQELHANTGIIQNKLQPQRL
jgi:hypothetical protein